MSWKLALLKNGRFLEVPNFATVAGNISHWGLYHFVVGRRDVGDTTRQISCVGNSWDLQCHGLSRSSALRQAVPRYGALRRAMACARDRNPNGPRPQTRSSEAR